MTATPLHPNLGRIAADYDRLVSSFATGRLDAAQVNERASTLVARDDQGVRWRINTHTGEWQRQLVDGRWVDDRPPAAGHATFAATDLAVHPGASLTGVVAFTVDQPTIGGPSRPPAPAPRLAPGAMAVAALVVLLAVWQLLA